METTLPQNLAAEALSPDEARAIAKEAYIYGSPMVDGYLINYAYWLLPGNPQYKGARPEPRREAAIGADGANVR